VRARGNPRRLLPHPTTRGIRTADAGADRRGCRGSRDDFLPDGTVRGMNYAPWVALLAVGCSQQSGDEVSLLRQEVLALRQEVGELKATLSDVNTRTAENTADLIELRWSMDDLLTDTAELSPGEDGYSVARSNGLPFMIALRKVTPFADGQRILLHIGNPHNATYLTPKLTVRWGPRKAASQSAEDLGAWVRSLRTKEERILTDLRPGSWNHVTVTLAPASNEEVGYIDVGIELSTVSLRQ
jgi:Protein of unknown function (DUF3251)